MCRRPALWRYGLVPVLLNVIITGLMLLFLVSAGIFTMTEMHAWFVETGRSFYWEILTICALTILTFGLLLAAWKLLEGVLCGHFYGKLAREVELHLGTPREELVEVPFHGQVLNAVSGFLTLAFVNFGFLTLNCVPVAGSVAALCGALYFDCLILGRDFIEFPTGLRGLQQHEVREFCRRHRYHTLGLGSAVLLCSLIPVVGAVLLTTAATGVVLLHQRLESTASPASTTRAHPARK